MKTVDKNTFYKQIPITNATAIKPNYSDLANGGADALVRLSGAPDLTYYIISGAVPTTPAYGESKLIGGSIQMYCSGVTINTTPDVPSVSLYKLQNGVTISEGTLQPSYDAATGSPVTGSSVGANVAVYRTSVATDNVYMGENFDGANKSLGEVKMIRSMGNGTIEFSRAYLSIDDAVKKGSNLGNVRGKRKDVGIKYFVNDDGVVDIKPDKSVTRPWKTKTDTRSTGKKAIWKRPYFKWNKIKNLLQFDSPAAAASTPDMEPLATAGNTIFDEVHATSDVNNPFTSSETNPLMMTTAELSTAKKFSGGQAFRMYHLWDYSTESAYIQKMMGSRAITPSMTRASIFNIPRPHRGLDVQRKTIQSGRGYMAGTTPEISMKMNISKLGFTPYLAYDSQTTNTAAKKIQVSDWAAASVLGTGNTSYFQTATGTETLTSMLRSVAVTFSNYKPKAEHTTLDKFLRYGLQRFYEGEATEHIVGGIIFMKTGIDGPASSDPSVLSATTIPVTAIMGGGSTSALPSIGVLSQTGMVRLDITGTANRLENTELLAANYWQPQYNQNASTPATNAGLRNVEIPIDSWFDMTVCIDAGATNSAGSTCLDPYGASAAVSDSFAQLGSPMRAYFSGLPLTSGNTNENSDIDNVPYLDVIFPAWETGGFTYNKYNFTDNPETYPKHMTVWVQNYRWIEASTTRSFATSEAMFQFGDNGSPGSNTGPMPSGAAIEAELYIDDIQLRNFTPQTENVSASSSVTNQRALTFTKESVKSPFTTYSSGTSHIRSWSVSGATTTTALNTVDATEFITFGYDSPTIFPTGNYTSTASGYMLANGFGTFQYGTMERTTNTSIASPDYTMGAFVSTSGSASYTNSKYLGGQLYGNHSWTNASTVTQTASLASSDITLTGTHTFTTKGGACNGLVNLMTGAATLPSQDGFTSKGLMLFDISNTFNTTAGWTKRENIIASTKIIGFNGYDGPGPEIESVMALKVEDSSIFNKYLDEEYVIYRMGSAVPTANTGSAATLGWGIQANTVNKCTKIKLDSETDIEDNIVEFIVTMGDALGNVEGRDLSAGCKADDGTTDLLTEPNLIDLYICPKKYWLNLYQPANRTPRTYQNFLVVQNVDASGVANVPPTVASMQGTTWNESTYSYNSAAAATIGQNGVYTNLWDLDTSSEGSTLVLDKDYGYGTYDDETNKGGELYRINPIPGQYFYMDVTPLASDKNIKPEEGVVFLLGMTDNSSKNTLNIVGDDFGTVGDTKRPYILWEYKDELPKIVSPLKLEPNYNILSGSGQGKVDLYKLDREELNALKFTWGEEGDDVLYRLLYVDTNQILDKYDGTYFWAPLNEIPGDNSKAIGNWYSGSTTTPTSDLNTASVRDITGPAGYGFDGNAETGVTFPNTDGSINWGWHGKTQATFIAHGVPNATGTFTSGSMFNDYDNNYGSFDIHYTKAASAGANVTPKVTLVSGATTFSGKEYTLTSNYSFVNDGESPLFVVVTFDSTLPYDRVKMYVNGFLAASSKGDWVQNRTLYDGTGYTGGIQIGCGAHTTNSRFRGIMSECMVHSKCLHVPTQANEYVMSTASLPDMAGSGGSDKEVKYNARLFLFDYHNFIGSSTDRVATSTEVTWEATGI